MRISLIVYVWRGSMNGYDGAWQGSGKALNLCKM
jgi:hypothetical protein